MSAYRSNDGGVEICLSHTVALEVSVSQYNLQYRHLIPAPVDRSSVSALSYKHIGTTCQ